MPCTHYPTSTVMNILPLLFCLTVFIYLFCFLVEPRGMQDLSSLAKDKSHTLPWWKHTVLTTGPPGKSPWSFHFRGELSRGQVIPVRLKLLSEW